MKRLLTHLQRIRISREKESHSEVFMEWPFFLILTFAFVFVYIQSIFSNAALREPGRLILFTILMTAHIILHWFSMRLWKWNRVAFYLVIQSALAFTIVYIAANIGPLLGLYMGLIGETIGLMREKQRWVVAVVAVLLGLSFLNYILQVGQADWFWWLVAMLPLTFFVIVYVILYSRQAEAREKAQALAVELEAANRQLSDYAIRVEDLTIATERQRMARELHDTLSQGLAGLILQLEAVDAHLASDRSERARSIVQRAMEQARATLSDARAAIDDLRRSAPRDLGDAVRLEVERFSAVSGLPCDLEISLPVVVPQAVTEMALRAVAEGLTNIARHAQAKNAKLSIIAVKEQNELEIEICDDGIGFDPETIETGHYGLLGMRERVRLAGGRFEVHSAAGKGARLVIRFPLEEVL